MTPSWAYEDTTSSELFAKLSWHLAPRWTLLANATFTQERYYRTVGSSTLENYYGEPRNARMTLRGRF